MADVITIEDLQDAKTHEIFHAECITGRSGGVAGGAEINTATNPITGQTQTTFPKILADYADTNGGTFADGFTVQNRGQVFYYETGGIVTAYKWAGTPLALVVTGGTAPSDYGAIGTDWIDVSESALRNALAASSGATLVSNGQATVAEMIGACQPLSYYGNDASALSSLLNYAKTTGFPIRLDSDVTVNSLIDVDFAGAKLVWFFNGHSIISDIQCVKLSNLAYNSEIHDPQLINITDPWCITRWDSSGSWLDDGADVLATLTQTSAEGYYQPTSNDTDIWSSLTSAQQTQNILPRLHIYMSDGVKVYRPKGRMCGYLFSMCNHTRVYDPDIQSGGKGAAGTIVFTNLETTDYGMDNRVYGGTVRYGSYSGVSFLRNKQGGVHKFNPYRVGESGVKTYQNEVSGRSARCYEMQFTDITSFQTVFDGVDATADVGTETTRVDDYLISEYAWHKLPTNHVLRNITSIGCRKTGLVTDGSGGLYDKVTAIDTHTAGIISYGENSNFIEPTAINCNRGNNASYHQIQIPEDNMVLRPTIRTESFITAGQSLYAPNGIVANPVINSTLPSTIRGVMSQQVGRLDVSTGNSDENTSIVRLKPRASLMTNPVSEYRATLTSAVAGSETGYPEITATYLGVEVPGLKVSPDNGGVGILAMGQSVAVPARLGNGQISFRINGTTIQLVAKLMDGTVKVATIAS